MSLPAFHPQANLFSLSALTGRLFDRASKYYLFAQEIYPLLVAARSQLAECYCLTNGRAAIEPVLLLGITLWQFLENILDRLAFAAILDGLLEAGLVSRQHKQRLDSMYVVGKLARLNSLDCVRETLRLALEELAVTAAAFGKPAAWTQWWERYVEHQLDPRASDETLGAKLQQAGDDAWALHQWIGSLSDATVVQGEKVQLLGRVLAEHFEIIEGRGLAPRRAPVTAALQNPHEGPTPPHVGGLPVGRQVGEHHDA